MGELDELRNRMDKAAEALSSANDSRHSESQSLMARLTELEEKIEAFTRENAVSSSGGDAEPIGILELRIREIEAQDPLDRVYWKSLKTQLADTSTTDISGVAAKLRVVHDGIQFDVDRLDLSILTSAITDLQLLSKTRRHQEVRNSAMLVSE